MEQLDHVSQPLAFATAALGLGDSPRRDQGRNGSYSSDTDTEGSGRARRTFLGSRTKTHSPDSSSPTTIDGTNGSGAAKSSHLGQSIIDLRNEFDEIAEEGEYSASSTVRSWAEVTPGSRLRLVRFILFHPVQI